MMPGTRNSVIVHAPRFGHRPQGFTLIELMIVIAVIGIIAAIAIPAYTQFIEQSRRADGMDALQSAAQRLERCYSQYGSYDSDSCGVSGDVNDGFDSPEGYYRITSSSLDTTSFTLDAEPLGVQADDACGTFTLSNTGVRGVKDGSLGSDDCWR